jgi:hypothetical protein
MNMDELMLSIKWNDDVTNGPSPECYQEIVCLTVRISGMRIPGPFISDFRRSALSGI